MNTREIIKKAVYLPFRAYKGFILVTFLFLISEIISEQIYRIEIGFLNPIMVIMDMIISIIILGFCIAIVYNYIDESFDIKEVSITATAKVGFKDELIEAYYYSLAIIGTVGLSFALGIYHSISSIIDSVLYVDYKLNTLTLPKLFQLLSPEKYHQLAFSVLTTIAIFVILFAIFFSYCSFAKIRLKETGDMKESMNFVKLTKIIKIKGLKRYLIFVVLTLIVFAAVLVIMRTLESYYLIGSVISALAESFGLFFILDSYSLFYYSDNIN